MTGQHFFGPDQSKFPPPSSFTVAFMAKLDEQRDVRVTAVPDPGVLPAAERLLRLFNELRDELISTLLYVLGNRDDAQDAAQETFIKCWGTRDQLDQVLNLRAWIFRVAFNTAK